MQKVLVERSAMGYSLAVRGRERPSRKVPPSCLTDGKKGGVKIPKVRPISSCQVLKNQLPFAMSSTYEVTIQFSEKDHKSFSFEVQAKGIRWAIEKASKEMKEAYPCFVEGADFSIVEIKLNR